MTVTSDLWAGPGTENFSVLVFTYSRIKDFLGVHFCRGMLLFHIKIAHEATRVVRLSHPVALLTAHGHADAIRVTPTLQATADLIARVHNLTVVLVVSLGERLKNHRVFRFGRLDQIEEVLRRIVTGGAMWPTLVMLLVLVTNIVIILALQASSIIRRINDG